MTDEERALLKKLQAKEKRELREQKYKDIKLLHSLAAKYPDEIRGKLTPEEEAAIRFANDIFFAYGVANPHDKNKLHEHIISDRQVEYYRQRTTT